VERLPHGRHHQHDPRPSRSPRRGPSRHPVAFWTRSTVVAGTLALAGVLLPAGMAGATPATTASAPHGLKATLAEINKISYQISVLDEQYDALKIQLTQARREVKVAQETARRDAKLLKTGQAALGQIAAEGYMVGNVNPTLTLLQTSNPQQYLDQASIMLQLQQETGDKVDLVSAARSAAARARAAALQEEAKAVRLQSAMRKKVTQMQTKENVLNDSAFKQAMGVYQRTGHFPVLPVHGNSIPAQALRKAETKIGDWYQWGAAGPSVFDCSGLVVWAYAQLGISLPHYTGDIWNLGVHVARDQLQPGDLVFFFPNVEHMGIYVGNGEFLDAPATGQKVQIQAMLWADYDGAVRIA
jgi:cell wall-associated NlpC family hydrolase/outer membrane murein-binding lipoprotein Lpp